METARWVLREASHCKIWKFEGGMGAGKTTFISAIAQLLGSADHVTSPTFSLVNEYIYPEGKIYHFDFYRIQNEQEAIDMGLYDYLDSGQFCFIEWPSCIAEVLKSEPGILIQLDSGPDDHYRKLSLTFPA